MRKAYKLENLDCANCAAKMEDGIGKLEGVTSAKISFMTQKLVIDTTAATPDELNAIVEQAQKVCASYEPDCLIVR